MKNLLKVDKVKKFDKKSQSTIGVFQSTIEKLSNTNIQITEEKAKKEAEIEALTQETADLEKLHSKNQKIIANIHTLLTD